MQCWKGFAVVGLLLVGTSAGCGSSNSPDGAQGTGAPPVSAGNSPAPSTTSSANSGRDSGSTRLPAAHLAEQTAPQSPLPKDASPDAVVAAFLEATRRGDDQVAASLLSQKALEETTKIGLAVKPPGTPSMEYHIEGAEFVEGVPDGAYVNSTWTEQYEGEVEQFEVTWILRHDEVGWRIVGMAAETDPNEPPYVLNFEEPSELYRQMQEELAEEAGLGNTPGQNPSSDTVQPLRSASPNSSEANQLR
jgi:hypothetical protein